MAIPVTLDDAKRQLRLELDDVSQDDEIAGFILDAAAWVEDYTGHVLIARDVTAAFEGFANIVFREWPMAADAVPIVTYVDGDGQAVSVTDVRAMTGRRPVSIIPWAGSRWPAVSPAPSVTVTIRAGYEDADPVPGAFRRAMLLLIAAYDVDREGGDIFAKAESTARRLCRDYRVRRL